MLAPFLQYTCFSFISHHICNIPITMNLVRSKILFSNTFFTHWCLTSLCLFFKWKFAFLIRWIILWWLFFLLKANFIEKSLHLEYILTMLSSINKLGLNCGQCNTFLQNKLSKYNPTIKSDKNPKGNLYQYLYS